MKTLKVYFTSDTHGYILPTDFVHPETNTGLLAMPFEKDGNTLVLDGGDSLQGSPLTYRLHAQGAPSPVPDAMNDRGYDVVTLGNHDFNFGYDALYDYLTRLNARCVCANVTDLTGRLPIRPYVVKTMQNGLRVGLLGLVTDWVLRWETPEHLKNFRITKPLDAARAVFSELRGQCDVLIGLYHGGVERDLQTGAPLTDTDENVACALCEALPFDLLLTGHQHLPIAQASFAGVPLAQTPANARQYVLAEYDGARWSTRLETPPCCPPLPEAFERMREETEAWLDEPIGHLARPLQPEDKLTMALRGSPIAAFFNRVQREATGADLSCCSLANDIRGFDARVTVRDVVTTYIYSNTLVVRQVTGRVLRQALEQCATYFDVRPDGTIGIARPFLQPKEAHYNYDFFDGLDYTFDLSCPPGRRVARMARNGREIGPDEVWSLVMCNYRSTGAGGFDCYLNCPVLSEGQTEVSELILDYFASHPYVDSCRMDNLNVILSDKGASAP